MSGQPLRLFCSNSSWPAGKSLTQKHEHLSASYTVKYCYHCLLYTNAIKLLTCEVFRDIYIVSCIYFRCKSNTIKLCGIFVWLRAGTALIFSIQLKKHASQNFQIAVSSSMYLLNTMAKKWPKITSYFPYRLNGSAFLQFIIDTPQSRCLYFYKVVNLFFCPSQIR